MLIFCLESRETIGTPDGSGLLASMDTWRQALRNGQGWNLVRHLKAGRPKRRVIRGGQVLMGGGAIMAVVHGLAHLGVFGGQPSGTVDLLVGYPAAALLLVVGAIAAGQ